MSSLFYDKNLDYFSINGGTPPPLEKGKYGVKTPIR